MKGTGSRKFAVYLALTIMYAALIFYLSSQSHLPQSASELKELLHTIINMIGIRYLHIFEFIIIRPDKLEHFLVFFVFGVLLRLTAAYSRYPPVRVNAMLVALMIGIVYGALDELHQMFVPCRHPSIYDFIADAAGIVCSQVFIVIVMWVYVRLQKSRNR